MAKKVHIHKYVRLGTGKYCRGCGMTLFKTPDGRTIKLPRIGIVVQ